MPRLSFLHSDRIYQFSQDKTLCLLYLLSVGVSRLDVWFRFHVGFHALLWEDSAGSLRCRVTSPGSLKSRRLFDAGFALRW